MDWIGLDWIAFPGVPNSGWSTSLEFQEKTSPASGGGDAIESLQTSEKMNSSMFFFFSCDESSPYCFCKPMLKTSS